MEKKKNSSLTPSTDSAPSSVPLSLSSSEVSAPKRCLHFVLQMQRHTFPLELQLVKLKIQVSFLLFVFFFFSRMQICYLSPATPEFFFLSQTIQCICCAGRPCPDSLCFSFVLSSNIYNLPCGLNLTFVKQKKPKTFTGVLKQHKAFENSHNALPPTTGAGKKVD